MNEYLKLKSIIMTYNEFLADRMRRFLKRKKCREMDFTKRPMKGFVFIEQK
jgi:hypothetical protein